MGIPDQISYSKDHEWASYNDAAGVVTVGITKYAAEKLGEIVFVELPEEGETFASGDVFGTVESTKSVSDLLCPASGEIAEVNEVLIDSPEIINEDPFNEGWLVRIKVDDPAVLSKLLSPSDYEAFIGELDGD